MMRKGMCKQEKIRIDQDMVKVNECGGKDMVTIEQVKGLTKVEKPIVKSARISRQDAEWLQSKGIKFQAIVDAAIKELRGA
jgi:hypothetical protein